MSKYGNKRTEYNGHVFHSKREAAFAQELELLKRAKDKGQRVKDIKYQPVFPIVINDKKVCKYVGDFDVLYADGRRVLYDVKGFRTAIYRLKKKLMDAVYGIEIVEV